MQKAKADGRISYMGFSFHDDIDVFKEIADAAPWDFCQIQLNYLDKEFQGGIEAAKYAAKRGMGVIVMEPLRGGHLVNAPDKVQEVFDKAATEARASGKKVRTPVQWAFDYLWNMPEISIILSGMGDIVQIDENCAYADVAQIDGLSETDKKVFDEAEKAFASYPTIPCTGCNYCNVCPEGITIPYNFQTYNQYIMSGNKERAIWEYTTSIPLNGAQAEACTGCGTCEERCPQHIKISEWMPKIEELFAQ